MKRTLWTVMLLLLIVPVTALQLSPAAKSFTVQTPVETSYELRIVNDGDADLPIEIGVPDAYDDLVSVTPAQFTLAPGDRRVQVEVNVDPSALHPGKNLVSITVRGGDDEGQFGGGVVLLHNLALHRPYAGAFIEGTLTFGNDRPLPVALGLTNRGQRSTTAEARLEIADPEGNVVQEDALGELSLVGLASGKMQGTVADLPNGSYAATAHFVYIDGSSQERGNVSARFRYGRPRVTVPDGEVTLTGEIIAVDIPVTLDWNEPLEAVATIELQSRGNKVGETATSATTTLESGTQTVLRAFLEPVAYDKGSYDLVVTVKDANGIVLRETTWTATVTVDNGTEIPAEGSEVPSEEAARWPYMALAIIVLVMFVYVAMNMRKRREK